MAAKPFVYDPPGELLYRLFQLDLGPDDGRDLKYDAPLRGRILSLTFDWDLHDIPKTFVSLFTSDTGIIMEKLSGSSKYLALSYRWGNEAERFPLYLSTIESYYDKDYKPIMDQDTTRPGYVSIPRNLRDFLLQLRKSPERKRFIWIDAMCIDQSDEQDKEWQIKRMKDIYDSAEQVLVWLGSASETEAGALRIMTNVTQRLLTIPTQLDEDTMVAAFNTAELPERGNELWKAYANLFRNEYWSRVWCLQEAAVVSSSGSGATSFVDMYKAPNVLVLCGQTRTRWDAFDQFEQALEKCGLKRWLITGQHGMACDDLHGLDAMGEVRTTRASLLRYGWAPALSAVLVATRRRTATDPVDMVWGMLSLLDRASIRQLDLKRSMSPEEVFIRFGKHYLRNETKECLLNHTATKEKRPGMPSWCPNFASHEETISIGSRWLGHNQETSPFLSQMPCAGVQSSGKWKAPRRKLFYANAVMNHFSGKLATHGQYDTSNPRQISLLDHPPHAVLASGIELDVVTEVIGQNPAAETLQFLSYHSLLQTQSWDQECFNIARSTLDLPDDDDKLADWYARTITANRVTMRLPLLAAEHSSDQNVHSPADTPEETIIFDRHEKVDLATPYRQFRTAMQSTLERGEFDDHGRMRSAQLPDHASLQFADCLRAMSRGRSFFVTKHGRIGLGPSDAAPGDRLVVFFYCPTPYLIRQNVTPAVDYTFVGETYVHGLMYGETLAVFDRGEVSETKWVIL